eukprot:TRINITY_DN10647_c0_g1_i2.p1 TRINITY_DN10647_c0_g1~~TRINITY_DN10647_c0_g1_i2.p1  ORF type:complete len:168 (+),score=27.56 TRINITY_DN10647_c0_g1_i2:96-599(+)
MKGQPPRSTLSSSSAASDVYKRQVRGTQPTNMNSTPRATKRAQSTRKQASGAPIPLVVLKMVPTLAASKNIVWAKGIHSKQPTTTQSDRRVPEGNPLVDTECGDHSFVNCTRTQLMSDSDYSQFSACDISASDLDDRREEEALGDVTRKMHSCEKSSPRSCVFGVQL